MTLLELQQAVCDALNADETLRLGGCEAMPEDALDIAATIARRGKTARGVALIVLTTRADRSGSSSDGIPLDVPELGVAAVELPTLNRARPGALTALAAAQRAAVVLDSPEFAFKSLAQAEDEQAGLLTATATFSASIILT